ncbi:diguanylate cyclase/phosphodiesterase with PAS/PAC sensor(s) [Desulfuromonas acetoxidans DSM 684]|uniref:Diguanylate cyclase/phosphodiesterase with PAS/PAC sensor(S) n=2 Tax=Desulfuromonas acetoxidans TaxID=891 RepID=Q1K3I2_DESA6|nr:diguanylate cyclase/phosphodiesterase with PAS/PAC sensor(s) [Desulfuromonas acetoxidans DSM 684]
MFMGTTIVLLTSFLLILCSLLLWIMAQQAKEKNGLRVLSIAILLTALGLGLQQQLHLSENTTSLARFLLVILFCAGVIKIYHSRRSTQRNANHDSRPEQFYAFFQHGGAGMYSYDTAGRILNANPAFCSMIGYSEHELKSMTILDVTPPQVRDETLNRLARFRDKLNEPCNFEKTYLCKDGSTLIGHFTGKWIVSDNDSIYAVALVQDITEHKNADQAVLKEREFLQTVIDGIADPIMAISTDYHVILANRAARESHPEHALQPGPTLCYQLSHGSDTPCSDTNQKCPLCQVLKTGKEAREIHEHLRAGHEKRTYEIKASPLYNEDHSIRGIIETSRDLTDILNSEAELNEKTQHLQFVTTHDQLTHLPNKELFFDRLERATFKTHRSPFFTALLFIDLDRFKHINDSLGHEIGDQLLQEVAKRLSTSIRKTDTLARMGGDEFLIIIEDIKELSHVSTVAKNFIDTILPSFTIDGHELFITPSMGISIAPTDTQHPKELLAFAEIAMYQAKGLGGNKCQFYTAEMNSRAKTRIELESYLRKAVNQDQFVLYYQPQFDIQSGELVGCEALLRWQHPQMGMISPNDFIPLAEETGVIIEIGEWVLQEACLQNKKWQDAGHSPIRVAVNISPRQFREPGFLEMIERVVQTTGIKPEWLELEITESLLMDDIDSAINILKQLKAKGIHLAIDDFGTGYSSLSYLKRFPLSRLKIDRSFVRDITTDDNDASITKAVIALAHSMNLKVVAEGIETQEQLLFLKEKGCEVGQGYLYSPPVAKEPFDHFFTDGSPDNRE